MNELAKKIHENAVKHGFYDEEKQIGTLLMLCVSELSEALEADRKGRCADMVYFKKIQADQPGITEETKAKRFKEDFEAYIKNSIEDELADTIIRVLDMCGYLGIDIDEHIRLKMKYNGMRENKHGKRY